jgi:hypothetical protein
MTYFFYKTQHPVNLFFYLFSGLTFLDQGLFTGITPETEALLYFFTGKPIS